MDDPTHSLTIAVATRPHPAYNLNGDGWAVHWNATGCRIALIDGLGHGPDAAHASDRARETLDADPDIGPGEAIHRCHAALHGTRGAAMTVVQVSLTSQTMTHSAIGNVETQFWNGERVKRQIARRGIVGRMLPRVREEIVALDAPDWLLLIYSDGIRERFDLESLPEFIQRDTQSLADHILRDWSRETDDATVVVVMPSHSSSDASST